jgi:hypothetical protein
LTITPPGLVGQGLQVVALLVLRPAWKDLQLTPQQQQQVRPLLQEHYDRIQTLLDKNPKASRQELAPQIHAISDDTHHQIHALLTTHQKELEKAMQQREHNGEENRRRSALPSEESQSHLLWPLDISEIRPNRNRATRRRGFSGTEPRCFIIDYLVAIICYSDRGGPIVLCNF